MMRRVRTTVSLRPDVAASVRAIARERNLSFTDALDAVLRRGLAGGDESSRPYLLPTRPLGLRQGIDLDKALRLAAEVEDAETIRKLELRK